MEKIPAFTPDGLLPPGDYEVTFSELRQSILVLGPGEPRHHPNWDAGWREKLVTTAELLVGQLRDVGITNIFLDGSFVEEKDHPNDIDGYFECDFMFLASGDLQRELNVRDPRKAWTWSPLSRRGCKGFLKKQLPMWHQYRVELYPHPVGSPIKMLTGIKDKFGNDLEFPSAFRQSSGTFKEKGIIRLVQ